MSASRQTVQERLSEFTKYTSWDARALGLDTFKVSTCSEEILRLIV